VFCSGEALPAQLQNDYNTRIAADLHNLYGPTEAAVDVTYWHCERDDKRSNIPIGRPIANTQIYILDVQHQSVPLGVVGELYIGGVNLGRGYLGRPDLTAERFVPNPFGNSPGARLYRTGDLARFGGDGVIEYVGRTDHQVKIRGFRIELAEIEAVLEEHPNVSAAVLATFEQEEGDPMLSAYFVRASSPPPSTTELRQFLLERLPEYMTPSIFVELQQMPLTTSGKVDRRHLPPPQPVRPNLANVYAGPQTEIEGVLVQIWQKVLRIDRLGIHDNFFDVGGHSLRMTQVIALIEQQTGMRISILDAFEHPTIQTLALHLSRRDKQEISVENRAQVRSGQKLRVEHMRNARQKHRAASEA
jgi:acyl carrier protein